MSWRLRVPLCSNGLVWQELCPPEYCVAGSQNAEVSLDTDTTTASHGIGHVMEWRRHPATAAPAPTCNSVWEGHGTEIGAM